MQFYGNEQHHHVNAPYRTSRKSVCYRKTAKKLLHRPRRASPEDAKSYIISDGCSLETWDPDEQPIMLKSTKQVSLELVNDAGFQFVEPLLGREEEADKTER
jgi:hypothetical protein